MIAPLKCPVGAKFALADQIEIVSFTILSESIVKIVRKRSSEAWRKCPWLNIPPHRVSTLSLKNARKLFGELLADGYWVW